MDDHEFRRRYEKMRDDEIREHLGCASMLFLLAIIAYGVYGFWTGDWMLAKYLILHKV